MRFLHRFVRKAATLLHTTDSSNHVACSFDGLLEKIREALHRYPESTRAIVLEQMLKTSRHFGSQLFTHYDHPDLPSTDNELERVFRDTRRHERLITGHKSTARRTVRDGPLLVSALQRARADLPSAQDLRKVPEPTWKRNLHRIREARTRFDRPRRLRKNLSVILQALVNQCRALSHARPCSSRGP